MVYAVAGVSGNTGRVVAEQLLAQGKSVRVIVRDAAKGAVWAEEGAEVAVADLADAAALTKALSGVQGAYLLLPPNLTTGNFRAYQDRVGQSLVRAVEAAEVPHVVLLSSIAAHHPAGTGPIAGLHPVETALRTLPRTRSTFVRAAYFMENLLGNFSALDQGILPSFVPANVRFPMVATADIGKVAAQELLRGATEPVRIVELGSEGNSNQEVADILSKLKGRTITVAEGPVSAMTETLVGYGFPRDIAEMYQEMTAGLISGHVSFEGGHARVIGETSLATFLAKSV